MHPQRFTRKTGGFLFNLIKQIVPAINPLFAFWIEQRNDLNSEKIEPNAEVVERQHEINWCSIRFDSAYKTASSNQF